jgi:hypothetical protein
LSTVRAPGSIPPPSGARASRPGPSPTDQGEPTASVLTTDGPASPIAASSSRAQAVSRLPACHPQGSAWTPDEGGGALPAPGTAIPVGANAAPPIWAAVHRLAGRAAGALSSVPDGSADRGAATPTSAASVRHCPYATGYSSGGCSTRSWPKERRAGGVWMVCNPPRTQDQVSDLR